MVAHDLQSPLNAIMLIGDDLAGLIHSGEKEEAIASLTSITSSVTRMQRLIRKVLDYSQVDWGGPTSFTVVDCNELLARTLEVLGGDIRASGSIVTAERLPSVQADPDQLTAVLQNLISNAIKYRKPGTGARVHVSAYRATYHWLFTVRDEGIGIAEADTRRIFRMFERLGRKQDAEGAGIGLAICQRVVERHGGRIWAESELGKGSSFCFTLPAIPPPNRKNP
jgi:signal transduction histidine kinase